MVAPQLVGGTLNAGAQAAGHQASTMVKTALGVGQCKEGGKSSTLAAAFGQGSDPGSASGRLIDSVMSGGGLVAAAGIAAKVIGGQGSMLDKVGTAAATLGAVGVGLNYIESTQRVRQAEVGAAQADGAVQAQGRPAQDMTEADGTGTTTPAGPSTVMPTGPEA